MAGPLPPPPKTSVRNDKRPSPDSAPAPSSAGGPGGMFGGFANGSMITTLVSTLSSNVLGRYAAAFGIVWFVFGFAGFIMSFICFGYTGNAGEKILGLILAMTLGPVYWIYYFVSPSYCKANPPAMF